jgi:ABC-type multidrug transport system permease subunit
MAFIRHHHLSPYVQLFAMQERPSGMYNLSAYYIARTAADIPAELLNTVLFVIIAYWFGGLRHDTGAFFGLLFSLVLVVSVAESWGLLIGGVCMDPKTAQVGWFD